MGLAVTLTGLIDLEYSAVGAEGRCTHGTEIAAAQRILPLQKCHRGLAGGGIFPNGIQVALLLLRDANTYILLPDAGVPGDALLRGAVIPAVELQNTGIRHQGQQADAQGAGQDEQGL